MNSIPSPCGHDVRSMRPNLRPASVFANSTCTVDPSGSMTSVFAARGGILGTLRSCERAGMSAASSRRHASSLLRLLAARARERQLLQLAVAIFIGLLEFIDPVLRRHRQADAVNHRLHRPALVLMPCCL